MKLENYADLERAIAELEEDINRSKESLEQLDKNSTSYKEEEKRINDHIRTTTSTLNVVKNMKRHYDTMYNSIMAMRKIDEEHTSNDEEKQRRLDELEREIQSARNYLPKSMQQEIRERVLREASSNLETPSNNPVEAHEAPLTEISALYDEFKKLRDEVSDKNFDETGTFKLRTYRRSFENFIKRNLELQNITRTSNADLDELRQVLNLGGIIKSEIEDTLKPINQLIDIKMTLDKRLSDERNGIIEDKENNLKIIEDLEKRLEKTKRILESLPESETRTILEEIIKSDEEKIEKLKAVDARYANRIKELNTKLLIISLGGKLPELDEIRKNTAGISQEEARAAEEKVRQSIPAEGTTNGFVPVTPRAGSLPRPEVPQSNPEPGPEGTPTEEEDGLGELDGDNPEPGSEGTPIGEEDGLGELDENEPEPASTRTPKSKLWSKLNSIQKAAVAFLGVIAIATTGLAVHSGLIARYTKNASSDDTETVEEDELIATDYEQEAQVEETAETPGETTETSAATQTSTEPSTTPTATPTTQTPTVTVGPDDVVLGPGESVYDTTTGVEVGYTGTAARETSSGTTSQSDRNLEHVTNSTVVVRAQALQPDKTQEPLTRTGQEIPEDAARANMTQGERDNLDSAIGDADWDNFFSSGPTL